ncbi:(Fe-S)-binding protein [Pseudonocardia sulfidoxydans NBRC 16205]|uniref:(Fe-S)-binding protein n=2 Tax=Pseudonocardia sulfidoxydans TaxID=54011 RepID=A0A511D9P5_9PSEU|nr:Rieske 2Fe-2S domain-containing protein [Pseudonocardia sulfidoxydans]GEL21522.1 (Fe-S)-binding protein [Pseudonocardia sulfidoxydans NBRC 16205]
MLTAEQNDELTQVDAGTPMGEVLRRYWYPVAFTRELAEFPVKRVELLGEFFALWRSPSGRYGIVPEACPHRKASLAYGVVESDGLRCPYHGWVFDEAGACVEQPAERDDTRFGARVSAQAGVAEEMGGLVWAYVGPGPAPRLPRFDTYVMEGFRDIGWADLPCNYVQIMENAVDPHHVEWLHGRYFQFIGRHEGFTSPASFAKKHQKVGFTPFEWGIIKRRVLEGASEDNDDWKVGHPLVFPYNMRVGGGGVHQMQIRVPINRTTTRFMLYTVHRPDEGYEHVEQPVVPDYNIPVVDEKGRHVVNYVEGQDIMAWVTQGAITDRTTEHLGRSDIGVAMLRKMFREQMDRVARGEDPLGTIREEHERIDLPCEKDKFHAGAQFALDFCDMGSTRFSPMLDAIKKIHVSAAERVASGSASGSGS